MQTLMAADSDGGRDLFDAFRPCYIRAYNDAKDIMDAGGKVLEGTKKATETKEHLENNKKRGQEEHDYDHQH